ncbi:hypothetical protein ACFFUE_07320 [Bergeyella porcorum]|uniref:hypothetical protein n=1 Tax=Bergeyella porcorum TaxID=1735111 RepID=UPI0035E5E0CB
MKQLEIISKRIATTAKEVLNGREVIYQYDTTELSNPPTAVSFSTFGSDGKTLSGSYSQGGGFAINGNGITQVQDLGIIQGVFATMIMIVNGSTSEVNNEVGDNEILTDEKVE